jgi:hypothetical protein
VVATHSVSAVQTATSGADSFLIIHTLHSYYRAALLIVLNGKEIAVAGDRWFQVRSPTCAILFLCSKQFFSETLPGGKNKNQFNAALWWSLCLNCLKAMQRTSTHVECSTGFPKSYSRVDHLQPCLETSTASTKFFSCIWRTFGRRHWRVQCFC